jgi:16S rRNA (adenine1518-N6/adenine1519-N6)-dimethyltransferase
VLKLAKSQHMQIKTTKAKKHFGQNFLTNTKVLEQIFYAAEITEQDQVLEIGPGTGNLTQLLSKACPNYLGLEVDLSLEKHLKDYNVSFMDALEFRVDLHHKGYKLIANIPYYITSPILNHYLMQPSINNTVLPERMILMVQKEVAEKICDPAKTSYLQTSIKTVANTEYLFTVPAKDFDPAPKVDSAVIKITPSKKLPEEINLKKFLGFLKICYSKPRKKIKNNLKNYHPKVDQIDKSFTEKRPEELVLEQYIEIYLTLFN